MLTLPSNKLAKLSLNLAFPASKHFLPAFLYTFTSSNGLVTSTNLSAGEVSFVG